MCFDRSRTHGKDKKKQDSVEILPELRREDDECRYLTLRWCWR